MSTAAPEEGPKFFLDIEGEDHPWASPSITVPQLRELAGWDAQQQVVEVDLATMVETTLADDQIVQLKPGRGFAKKIRFQRG
jgi:hypothetical protein